MHILGVAALGLAIACMIAAWRAWRREN